MAIRNKTVLVVDDEDAVCEAVCGILQGAGYNVLEARDYEEAIAVYRQHQEEVDLVLTDLSLPGRNGWEVAKTLLESHPGLKVLYMSGRAGAEAGRYYGLLTTDVHFLEKPFQSAELLERVAYALRWDAPMSRSMSV